MTLEQECIEFNKPGGHGLYTEEFKCAQCGAVRYRNGSWAFKRMWYSKNHKCKLYFCSYTCMRAWDKEKGYDEGGGTEC